MSAAGDALGDRLQIAVASAVASLPESSQRDTDYGDRNTIFRAIGNAIIDSGVASSHIANSAIDSEHDIDITVGGTTTRKRIDDNFSKGDGGGGLDTGIVQNNKFYYFHQIIQDSTNDLDYIFSLSKTSPTIPSGWSLLNRISGAVLTDGSANILGFSQKDNFFKYRQIISNFNAATGTSRISIPISVPPDFLSYVVSLLTYTGLSYAIVHETADNDRVPSLTDFNQSTETSGNRNVTAHRILVDSSSQIAFRATQNVTLRLNTIGFYDNG